jgi:hypothetical protein
MEAIGSGPLSQKATFRAISLPMIYRHIEIVHKITAHSRLSGHNKHSRERNAGAPKLFRQANAKGMPGKAAASVWREPGLERHRGI